MGLVFPVTPKKREELNRLLEKAKINPQDLKESFVKGFGKGGQKTNKSANAVVLVHLPTQTQVFCHQTRSLGLNRYYARKILAQKILGIDEKENLKIKKQKQKRKKRSRLKKETSKTGG